MGNHCKQKKKVIIVILDPQYVGVIPLSCSLCIFYFLERKISAKPTDVYPQHVSHSLCRTMKKGKVQRMVPRL
ncbi:hypothetical protein L2E82_13289 [Cichorium intybus]|uniref:Uncharacterized protein n=1 Tax=Cichorium intybus TaxID=13427 RepID=A0ACB9GI60_CICIN|nr:hypothetical protein L2E82_13289 [Cichorium intybus]